MGERYKPLSNRLRHLLAEVMFMWYAVTRGSSDDGYSHCLVRTHSISTRCAQIASHSQHRSWGAPGTGATPDRPHAEVE
jgi:hypothetical protein